MSFSAVFSRVGVSLSGFFSPVVYSPSPPTNIGGTFILSPVAPARLGNGVLLA